MSTTDMYGSTESSPSSARWSDLPDELLGIVRVRLASPWARVRLAAVCRAWRAASSRLPAPPAVPLLLVYKWTHLSGPKRLCGPVDGCVVRVPERAENMRFVGSHDGGWVAAVEYSKLVIMNLFSGAEVALSIRSQSLYYIMPRKIIFSGDPTSSGCILASNDKWRRFQIGVCKIGGGGSGWTAYQEDTLTDLGDIAFCNSELYGLLHPGEKLVKFKIDMEEDGTPVIKSSHRLAIKSRDGPTYENDTTAYNCHLFELHGKPSMAIQTRWLPSHEPFFKIFTLVDTNSVEAYKYKWVEVTSFGDHALFLGPFWSKAVHVAVDQHYGLERNHIYYTEHIHSRTTELPDDAMYSVTIAEHEYMYYKKDQNVGDGVERTGYYVTGGNNLGIWLYPPDL
ncbi:uncharacterized protein [Lolium perenne]|uniref:uncharacterized protein n=1 Tax=Lolium perenne TaxID=4522 RepID=UPI0021F555CF|nr:uncharacterized protein LOC127329436 [Lolium perenne]